MQQLTLVIVLEQQRPLGSIDCRLCVLRHNGVFRVFSDLLCAHCGSEIAVGDRDDADAGFRLQKCGGTKRASKSSGWLGTIEAQGSSDAVRAAVTTEQILKAAGTASLPTSSLQGGLASFYHLRFQHILHSRVAGIQLHRQYECR